MVAPTIAAHGMPETRAYLPRMYRGRWWPKHEGLTGFVVDMQLNRPTGPAGQEEPKRVPWGPGRM